MLHLCTKGDFVTVCEDKLEKVALVKQQEGMATTGEPVVLQ